VSCASTPTSRTAAVFPDEGRYAIVGHADVVERYRDRVDLARFRAESALPAPGSG
jgi:hypothetical protein